MENKKSDYGINSLSVGIFYRFQNGDTEIITFETIKELQPDFTEKDFEALKLHSDEIFRESYNNAKKQPRRSVPLEEAEYKKQETTSAVEDEIIKQEDEALSKKEILQLHRAIESLTETQKRRVRLFYFLGLTEQEIANLESAKQQSVNESLSAAMKKLKKYFN